VNRGAVRKIYSIRRRYKKISHRFDQVRKVRVANVTAGGLRFQLSARQDRERDMQRIMKRTQNRTDTSFGLSYGIPFFEKLWRAGPGRRSW